MTPCFETRIRSMACATSFEAHVAHSDVCSIIHVWNEGRTAYIHTFGPVSERRLIVQRKSPTLKWRGRLISAHIREAGEINWDRIRESGICRLGGSGMTVLYIWARRGSRV